MTIYFRPDRIQYSYPTTAQEAFAKDDVEIYDVTLNLRKIVERKGINLIEYSIDEANHEILHKDHFIGLSAKGQFELQIVHKSQSKERQTVLIDFNEQIQDFKGCKNDRFTKQFDVGNYKIYCTYGYNKFLEVCGTSKFYEFTIEPVGMLADKVKKMKHDAFTSASKGLLNYEPRAERQVEKRGSEIIQKNNKDVKEQPTAFKEDKAEAHENHSKIIRRPQGSIFSQQEQKSDVKGYEPLTIYKGPCKTSNFFSCLDPKLNISKQYNFIEQSFN